MKLFHSYKKYCLLGIALSAVAFSACKKDGNPNNLPEVDASKYAGTVDGYASSDEVYKENLVAYFPFDDNYNEVISATTPTATVGNTLVAGIKGKAASLNAGYLYYGTQFAAFWTEVFKSFTISQWVQIANNGSKRTMLFQLARPGMLTGNININLNTQARPATNTDFLGIQPVFTTVGGGTQDNANANASPKIGTMTWAHIVINYNGLTGRFNIFGNGVNIGSYSDRGVDNNLFKSYEPNEVIVGGNYNVIPGKVVNTDASFAAMTGNVDEIRIYNTVLPDAIVKALYNLGVAGK
ncbi:MAG: LamG-like jellyroll fold domain-containing protein [Pedobacter sp.]